MSDFEMLSLVFTIIEIVVILVIALFHNSKKITACGLNQAVIFNAG